MEQTQQQRVTLSAPDGRTFDFNLGAVIDFEDGLYAVLVEMEADANGEEQLLITRWITDENGDQSFEVISDERIITAVFERYVAESIGETLADCSTEA